MSERVRGIAISATKGYAEFAAIYPLGNAARKMGLKVGNAGINEDSVRLMLDHPEAMLASAVIIGPAIEEAAFRLLPYKLAEKFGVKYDWKVKLASSVAFSLIHNVVNNSEGGAKISTERLHLASLFLGMSYTGEQQKHGYWNAFVRHAAFNSIPAVHAYLDAKKVKAEDREQYVADYMKKARGNS